MTLLMRAWNPVAAVWRCVVFFILMGTVFAQQSATYESLLASAQQAQARSDFEAAAGFYRRASAIHPEIAELKANLGLMYYQVNKNEEAAEAFEQAIRLNPRLFVPNLFLGLDYVKLKRFNQAIPYLERAAQAKPDDIHARIGLGQAYSGAGETHPAIRSYLNATELDPRNPDTWFRLGIAYLEQVEVDARALRMEYRDSGYMQALTASNFGERRALVLAAASYQKALATKAVPPDTHAGYGFVLLDQHDVHGAEREFRSELTLNPGSLLAKLGMARLDLERGSAEEAGKQIARIWNTDTGFLSSNVQRFRSGLDEKERGELQTALESAASSGELPFEAIELFRGDAPPKSDQHEVRNSMASSRSSEERVAAPTYYGRGAYGRCADLLISRLPNLPTQDLHLLAYCAYATGDYQHVFVAAAKLSASAATRPEGLYWETRSSQKLATAALTRASEMDASSPKLHVLLGDIFRQQEHLPDAEQEYRKALSLQPRDTGAVFGLSLALLADSRKDEALQVAQSGLQNNPTDPELNAVMGEILCERDEFAEAETYLNKSLNTKPEYVPHVHALLGKVYANTNRDKEAIAEFKLALPEDNDGRLHYQLGRLYLKMGDRASARQAFLISKRMEEEALRKPLKSLEQGQPDSGAQ